MPAFPKPQTQFDYDPQSEINNLENFRDTEPGRAIPPKSNNHILVATWNIANFGLQKRRDKDYEIISAIISWFDMVGIQEVNDNLERLRIVQSFLPSSYNAVFNDKAGNDERTAFFMMNQ